MLDWSARPLSGRRTLLVAVATVLAASVTFVACQGSGTPPAPSVAAAALPVANPAAASETALTVSRANTALVCHLNETGAFVPLFVNPQAVPAHLGHGDGQVGGPVPGQPNNVFGANCVITAPPATCPCNLLFDQTVAAWEAVKGPLHAGYTFSPPDNANCDSIIEPSNPGDHLQLSAGVGENCYASARVGGTFLVNTLIPANAAERTACIASVQSRCTP
jgi:hypothetical protein